MRESFSYCTRHPSPKDGISWRNFYPGKRTIEVAWPKETPVRAKVRELADGEASPWFAYWDNNRKEFRHVYPARFLTEMCFSDGGAYHEKMSLGTILNVVVEEAPEE